MQLSLFPPPPPDFVTATGVRPRDYQQTGIERSFELFDEGKPGAIFRQPTGTGKTVSGILIAEQWCNRGPDYHCLVLAHERQLVHQFADEIEDMLGVRPGVEMAAEAVHPESMPRIVVASRQTLLPKEDDDGETVSRLFKFDPTLNWLVLIDECHRWALKLVSCAHIIKHFEKNPNSRRLGLTATPERGDGVSLETLFPGVASDYRLYDVDGGPCAVRDGWAVEYDQRFVTVEGVDFKALREVAGDFDDGELEAILSEHETLMSMVKPTLDLIGDRRTIIFNPTVAMAKAVAHAINAERNDYQAAVSLDGSVPDHARADTYKRHQRGAFQVLSVCGLCREGYNDPGIQAVAVFRPTKSRTLAEQMKGRGCRPLRGLVDGLNTPAERRAAIAASDKPSCMIVDLVGVTGMADCASTAHIMAQGKDDKVVERANENMLAEDGPVDVAEEIRKAQSQIDNEERERQRQEREARERRAAEEALRRKRLGAEVSYSARQVEQGGGGHVSRSGRVARMPFGKHKGQPVRDIPTGYLSYMLPKLRGGWVKRSIENELNRRRGVPRDVNIDRANSLLQEIG